MPQRSLHTPIGDLAVSEEDGAIVALDRFGRIDLVMNNVGVIVMGGVEEIPLEAHIVAVADVFDALTSARPYKPEWSVPDSVAELRSMVIAGRLDPLCVGALLENLDMAEDVRRRHPEEPVV